jgi:multiphosphoryl transfer protein
LNLVHENLKKQSIIHKWPIQLGIMIEVPAAALMADELAKLCDFFSIGTNDLTQYIMAAERGHPALGAFADASHPAVLALIKATVEGASQAGIPVSVCGEAAGDINIAPLLIARGVRQLSMSAARLQPLAAQLLG